MQHPNPHGSSNPNGKTPSVPLTVYRELAAELQATQAMLDSLHAQNQQLARDNHSLSQHNQQLQSEMTNVVNAALHMQKVADSLRVGPTDAAVSYPEQPGREGFAPLEPRDRRRNGSRTGGNLQATETGAELPPLYVQPSQPQTSDRPEMAGFFPGGEFQGLGEELSDKNGIWLVVAIVAIVVVAFGGGYAFMRPIYERQLQQAPNQPPARQFEMPDR